MLVESTIALQCWSGSKARVVLHVNVGVGEKVLLHLL